MDPSATLFALMGSLAGRHGANSRAGLLSDYVRAVRVMDAAGAVEVVRDEERLRFYRSSWGLLGVPTRRLLFVSKHIFGSNLFN